jgi:hypothetical protein
MKRPVSALTERHMGREITTPAVTGVLTDVIQMPAGKGYVLGLIVGGRRAFTDVLAADTEVEIGAAP